MLTALSKLKHSHQVLFSIAISLAMVLFWRGIWGLADLFLFPDDLVMSFAVSVVVGLAILIATGFIVKQASEAMSE